MFGHALEPRRMFTRCFERSIGAFNWENRRDRWWGSAQSCSWALGGSKFYELCGALRDTGWITWLSEQASRKLRWNLMTGKMLISTRALNQCEIKQLSAVTKLILHRNLNVRPVDLRQRCQNLHSSDADADECLDGNKWCQWKSDQFLISRFEFMAATRWN